MALFAKVALVSRSPACCAAPRPNGTLSSRRRPARRRCRSLLTALSRGRPAPQGDRPLALPHLAVADIRWVDWAALRAAGFEGCVFDKDNTLTEPYSLVLHPAAADGLARCREAFAGRLVLYSNSAGLAQYDPEGGLGGLGGGRAALPAGGTGGRGGAARQLCPAIGCVVHVCVCWVASAAADAGLAAMLASAGCTLARREDPKVSWAAAGPAVGAEAGALEAALGVPVLRHSEKKPAGGPEDMERHFGCALCNAHSALHCDTGA